MSAAERQANLLGAFALVVTDQTSAAAMHAAGQSLSGAAALSAMRNFLDHPTLDQLRLVLGLTPSGAVRLVDRLADAGLVRRGAGKDARSRSVVLTAKGRKVADRIRADRATTLGRITDALSPDDAATLHTLLGRMMAGVVEEKRGGAWICRLCDTHACGRDSGHCPTANAAKAKHAAPGASTT